MFILTVTSDSPQSGSTSALVRLGADFAAVGRRTLLLDVLPRTDIAQHLGLPPDAPRAGPRQVGPNFIYAGLDAATCSYEALAASEADVVVADIGVLAGAEAQTFLKQVPASVLICLRSSANVSGAYAAAMNSVNGLISAGAAVKPLGVFVTRHDASDFGAAQAVNTLGSTVDLLCPPIPEAPGMAGPALVGSGMGELYRAAAEASRSLVLEQQRQATPVKVGLGDLATAYQQSGKLIDNQVSAGDFPTDGGEGASQYTYVLDSQALADVVGENAAPIVRHAEDDATPASPPMTPSLAPSAAPAPTPEPDALAAGNEEPGQEPSPALTAAVEPGPAFVENASKDDDDEPREALAFKKASRSRLMVAGALAAAVVVGIVALALTGGDDDAAPDEAVQPETTLADTRAPTPEERKAQPEPEPDPEPTRVEREVVEESVDAIAEEPERNAEPKRRRNRRKRRLRKERAP